MVNGPFMRGKTQVGEPFFVANCEPVRAIGYVKVRIGTPHPGGGWGVDV